MRKRKTIKIDDREVTVKELRIRDILELFKGVGSTGDGAGLMELASQALPRVTDLKQEELVEMAPSEIRAIYDAFKEVNAAFFDLARSVGLDSLLSELKKAIMTDLSGLFPGLSKPGTEAP